jgi:hypothetical protein
MGVLAAVGATNEVATIGGSSPQSASLEIDPTGVRGQAPRLARAQTCVENI